MNTPGHKRQIPSPADLKSNQGGRGGYEALFINFNLLSGGYVALFINFNLLIVSRNNKVF